MYLFIEQANADWVIIDMHVYWHGAKFLFVYKLAVIRSCNHTSWVLVLENFKRLYIYKSVFCPSKPSYFNLFQANIPSMYHLAKETLWVSDFLEGIEKEDLP